MKPAMKFVARFHFSLFLAGVWWFVPALNSYAADAAVEVQLDVKKAAPRAIEELTERGILRDYRFAWTSMAQALQFNTFDPLEGPFSGEAKRWLRQTVTSQQQSGLSHRYTDQNHRVEAVFYSPQGDVVELHDTAQYHLQILGRMESSFAEVAARFHYWFVRDGERMLHARRPSYAAAECDGAGSFPQVARGVHALVRRSYPHGRWLFQPGSRRAT